MQNFTHSFIKEMSNKSVPSFTYLPEMTQVNNMQSGNIHPFPDFPLHVSIHYLTNCMQNSKL